MGWHPFNKKNSDKVRDALKRAKDFVYHKDERRHYKLHSVGRMRVHEVTDYRLARLIHKDLENFRTPEIVYESLSQLIGGAMIIEDGQNWRTMHNILAESFSPRSVNARIAPIVLEECQAMVDNWKNRGQVDDVEKEMLRVTGRIVMRTIFGDTISGKDSDFILETAGNAISSSREPTGLGKVLRRLGLPYDHAGFLPSFALRVTGLPYEYHTKAPQHFLDASNAIDSVLYRVIGERRKLAQQPDDVLAKLIDGRKSDGGALTNTEIRDQVLMLIIAGHETTAESLTFSIREIARHAETQRKMRAEFNAVAQNSRLSPDDYAKLPQAQNALKEAMRLHPPVFMSTREAAANIVVDGVPFQKNDLIRMDLREIHNNPDFWDNPQAYDPSRFELARFPQAYMPFGTGPRVCLGMNMSMVEGTLMLSQIFNNVDVQVTSAPEGKQYYFTTRPDGKIAAKITPRLP